MEWQAAETVARLRKLETIVGEEVLAHFACDLVEGLADGLYPQEYLEAFYGELDITSLMTFREDKHLLESLADRQKDDPEHFPREVAKPRVIGKPETSALDDPDMPADPFDLEGEAYLAMSPQRAARILSQVTPDDVYFIEAYFNGNYICDDCRAKLEAEATANAQ